MSTLTDLLGMFTGSTPRNAATTAANAQRAGNDAAYAGAAPLITGGYNTAANTLGQQYNVAGSTLAGGFNQGSNLVSTAGTTARNDLTGTYDSALSSLGDLYGRAQTGLANTQSTLAGYFSPYMSAGTGAQNLYNVYLGTGPGGAAAAAEAGRNFSSNDPGIQYRLDQLARQSAAQANAGGFLGSGREGMLRTRSQNEVLTQDFQNYLSRLERQSGMGQQAASTLGGFTTTLGGLSAGLYGQQGNQASALTAQHGRDLAANETGTARTLADLLQTYTGRLAANDMAYGSQMANNAIGQGNSLAQLLASHETNNANATAQEAAQRAVGSAQGVNNLLNLASIAGSIYTGMPRTPAANTGPASTASSWTANTTATPNPYYGYF